MSKELNINRGYYQPGKSRCYTRNNLLGSVNPTFSKDVDMRRTAATNYAMDSYNSAGFFNTREANRAPINTLSSDSTSSSNIDGAISLLGEGHYNYGRSGGIQGPVSTSKVARLTYADSFVTYNINQDPMPALQEETMERDTVSEIVNPKPIHNYRTQKSVSDPNIFSGQSLCQNKESIRVIPAAERKGRPQNPDDLRFVLFPKEPTFNVKIIGGVRIAQKVTKISYRQSLKSTIVYTIGRKGGSCKKALAESKRKRALWWIAQGKTIEEAILLCLRPYHEIYEEILKKKHSWGTQMMIRNLLVQINKEGMYNPFIGRSQANESETSDDSAEEATEQHFKTDDESNQGYPSTNNKLDINVQQNFGHNSNNLMLCSLPTQDNMQNMLTQQEIGNSSSQNASYDPKTHIINSLADRNRPLPATSESESDLIHTKTDNYSLSSLADRERQPVNSKPVSKLIHTQKDNPYTKVNMKTETIKPKKYIRGAALRRYHYWLKVGKTHEEAIALCVVRMNKIPLYHQIKDTVGTLKNFVKRSRNQGRFRGTLSVAHTGPASMVDKGGYCDNTNNFTENVYVENPQEESESFIAENTEGSTQGLKNPNTSMTQVYVFGQNASYDPKTHIINSLADRNRPLPATSESESDLIHTKTDNYSLSSLADRERQPVNSKPVSKLIHTQKDNPYTKVNMKTETIKPKKYIRGAALRRYHYWLKVGKTHEEAIALCVVRMNKIPLYHQIKDTVGTLKNFVKRSRNQGRFRGTLSVAHTGPASMVDKGGYCDNTNNFTENVYVENPQEESESFIAENTEGSTQGLKNPNTSMTQVYLKEIEQFIKSLQFGSKKYKHIFEPVAIDKYRWWRHVGKTVNEAQKMCLYPFHCYPKEHEEGEKIIDFRKYIFEEAANLNIADETAKCPTEIKGHAKLRYNFWIKLGKTPKEAIDLTLQGFKPQRREPNLWSPWNTNPSLTQSSQNKINCYNSSVSIIPTIEENFTKDDCDVAHTGDYKNNIHTYTKRTEDNSKKQVEQATQLTNAELIRFEWWKKQGKSEEKARDLCHKSMAVSEALNHISPYKKERDLASNTYEGSKSNIPDLYQNPRREEISNKQIFREDDIKTDAMAETNFPQNIEAQEGLPITQNFEVPSNVKGSKQGEFRVCIKANKVNIDFDNLEAIKNSLNLCIADEDGIKIKNIHKKSNRVIITCLNEQTRDWLDKQIPTLVPWENAKLEIIDEDEVPIDILARFFIPFDTEAECYSVTREQFMQQLHKQNPDVGCDRWIVHMVESKTNPIGVYVLACIDKKSNDVLTSKNNNLKWFDKRNIKVKLSSTKKKSKAESGVRAVLFVPKVPECRLHSSQQYLLNKLHKLNPTIGCNGWTIVQKRIKPDGAALLVRLNNASKHIVENIKNLRWYRSQNIAIKIVPIYVNITFPIDNESSCLRIIPENQITTTLINKLHFLNPSFGCLKWVVVQLQDKVDEWHLTFKINGLCYQTLINSGNKLYWYGGRWLEIKLGAVPELEMFELKNNTKHSKKPATSYQPKENVTERNLNQIVSGSMLSPQVMVSEESKVQDVSNRGLPPSMLWNNPENRLLSSSRQDRTADMSYTEKEPYHYKRHYRVGSDSNETHQLLPAPLEYVMPEPEHASPPGGHGQGYLGLVGFGEKEDMAQEHYSHGIRRYDDEDKDTGLEDRHRLESNRDGYYPNTEHRNVENVDYDNDFNLYYNNEIRQEEEESRHLPHQDPDNIANPDPRSNEYMYQDIEGYHFYQHLHDRVDTREIDYVREERYFDTGERYYGRGGMNFERGQRNFNREKSPQDGARLHFDHVKSCQETENFQREWSPDHQNRSKYVDKRNHPRDDQWGQNLPNLRSEDGEALHDSRDSLNQNKRARLSEDRRHYTLNDGLKGLAVYHDRGQNYQESSSYSNHKRQKLRPSFDEPPSKRNRQRRYL